MSAAAAVDNREFEQKTVDKNYACTHAAVLMAHRDDSNGHDVSNNTATAVPLAGSSDVAASAGAGTGAAVVIEQQLQAAPVADAQYIQAQLQPLQSQVQGIMSELRASAAQLQQVIQTTKGEMQATLQVQATIGAVLMLKEFVHCCLAWAWLMHMQSLHLGSAFWQSQATAAGL